MAVIQKIAENAALIAEYRHSEKIKQTLVENLGRAYTFEQTEDFFEKHPIIGLDSLSKREKNVIAFTLRNNPYAEDIVNEYNHGMASYGQIGDRVALFKKINSISELLKAYPYNEPEFSKGVVAKVVEWGFEGNEENIRLLKKSLNLFADKNSIKDFIGNDSVKTRNAFALLRGIEGADKTAEVNCTLVAGTSAILAVGLVNLFNPVQEISQNILPKVSQFMGNNPFLTNATMFAVGGYAFYKTFQTIHKIIKEIVTKERDKQIVFCEPEKSQKDSAHSLIENRLIGPLIKNENFNVTNPDNEKYLALCTFMVEKLSHPNKKVPENFAKDYKLTEVQVERLNNLDYDKIHELFAINNPAIRQNLLLDEVSYNQKQVFKTISVMQDVAGISNKNDLLFKGIESIKNIPSELRENINSLSDVDKKLMTAYLKLFTNKDGVCSPRVVSTLYNRFNKENISEMLTAEMDVAYFNKQVEAPKNGELNYLKRVWNWITQKEKVELPNQKVKDLLINITNKYDLKEANNINEAYPTLLGQVKNTEEMVVENIQKLRAKVSADNLGLTALREKLRR